MTQSRINTSETARESASTGTADRRETHSYYEATYFYYVKVRIF